MAQSDKLTPADIRVLRLLQRDLDSTKQELAEMAGMSPSTLWRRVHEMEEIGAIRKRVALLDPNVIGFPTCVFLSVNLAGHEKVVREQFEEFVMQTPQIMECFSITGAFDYMLIVRARSVSEFETFLMERVLGHKSVASAVSQVALRQHKYSTEFPI
nr:Lrp/AsnC family transcriptional regulator [Hyphomonas sp. Mor2]